MLLRHILAIPAILLGALACQIVATVTNPQPSEAYPCADLIVGIDGTGSVNDPSSIVKNRVGPGAVMIAYPGSIWPIGAYSYDSSVRIGVDKTKTVIRDFRATYPCGTVHLTGHSQGARVAGDVVEELHAEGVDTSFISATLLSDPRHPGTGIEIRLHGLFFAGYTMRGPRGHLGGAQIEWVCNDQDPVCNWPQDLLGILSVPAAFVAHHGKY